MPGAPTPCNSRCETAIPALGGVLIDNLSYNAGVVPLPASAWSGLALIGGLGLLGGVKRFRKQTA